jgi:acetyl-CoA C-acetyltransferase
MLAARVLPSGTSTWPCGRHGVDEQRPYLLPRVREGLRMGNGDVIDSMIQDGLWCAFEDWHMGKRRRGRRPSTITLNAASPTRSPVRSHQRAAAATAERRVRR